MKNLWWRCFGLWKNCASYLACCRQFTLVGYRDNFVFDALINFQPVKGFKNKSNMLKIWGFDGRSNRIQNELWTIKLICRKIEENRITVVKFRINWNSGNVTFHIFRSTPCHICPFPPLSVFFVQLNLLLSVSVRFCVYRDTAYILLFARHQQANYCMACRHTLATDFDSF